jgi:hypothetical protein
MSGRAIYASIVDTLEADSCLMELLDTPIQTIGHGSSDVCDQPAETEITRPIRRESQGWPADFQRAIVTIGRLGASPFATETAKWLESWTFVVSIFVRESPLTDDGDALGTGDMYALDIYQEVRRLLAWAKTQVVCPNEIAVLRKWHEGDIIELSFNEKDRLWQIATRFRWDVVSRGLEAMAEVCNPCPDPFQGGGGGAEGNGGAAGDQTHFILRHFEIADMATIAGGGSFGDYDAFVYGHYGVHEEVVANLLAQGKMVFRYFEIMTFGVAGWSDPWFDFWKGVIQPAASLLNPSGDPAVFRFPPGCEDRPFVDWSKITDVMRLQIAEKMFQLAGPGATLFLDQAWFEEAPYFFFSEPGTVGGCGPCAYCASYASIPASKWPDFQASIKAFYELVDAMAANRGLWVLKNGEFRKNIGSPPDTVPRPVMFENAATTLLVPVPHFQNCVTLWKEDPRNLLSIDIPDPVTLPLMISEFDQNGGWISFTGAAPGSAELEDAYTQASAVKQSHVGG